MGCRYVDEFDFGPSKTYVKGYSRGGRVTPAVAVHKHEANMHPGKAPTKLAKGGSVPPVKLPPMAPVKQAMPKLKGRKSVPVAPKEPLVQKMCNGGKVMFK